jgi:hypothetical protein
MKTHSNLPRRLSGRHTAVGAAILMALFGIAVDAGRIARRA